MNLLLPMTPLSMVGAVHKLPIWMLTAAASSSWLVPAVVAAGDVDEGREESTAEHEHDVVVDHESTVAGASEFEHDDSKADDDKNDVDEEIFIEDDDDEEGDNDYSHMGLQLWPDGMVNNNCVQKIVS